MTDTRGERPLSPLHDYSHIQRILLSLQLKKRRTVTHRVSHRPIKFQSRWWWLVETEYFRK